LFICFHRNVACVVSRITAINKNTYAQTPEVNHTGKGSEIDTAEDSSTDGLSSEEVGDQPMNIDDAM
jgi:hypothetical protein